ncbi:Uncharacterised protein [Mycobacterium tuberculosis]|nr:Uncharacterised protein [Mycobacterium tuberculosis]
MRLLAISCRVQVVAPGDHQSVQAVQHAADALGVDRLRRQQYRNTPGHGDAFEVIGGQITRRNIPNPGAHLLQISRQANHRATRAQWRSQARRSRAQRVATIGPRGAQIHVSSPNR